MKIKHNSSFFLFLICLSIVTNSFGQSNNELIGDYKNSSNTLFAQVYKDLNGSYKINIVRDLISLKKPIAILNGVIENKNILSINGEGWSGKIENGRLNVKNENESIEMNSFKRDSPTINAKPPKDAIILFNGKNLDSWLKAEPKDWLQGTNPADNWTILPNGALEVTSQPSGEHESILTKQKFGDLKLHLEFRLLGEKTNGGVYFMSRYELNIKDAYGFVGETPIGLGNISKPKDLYPKVNVAFPPLEWQTFDVDFRAPRFDETGSKKTENARITVVHNGITIYKNVELEKVKGATGKLGEAGVGPIYLQDHGNVYQFRNIWVIDKTLKGTENYETATLESDEGTQKSEKREGNKSGGNSGKKESEVNNPKVRKSGGNKAKENKSEGNILNEDSKQIHKKGKTGDKKTGKIEKKGQKGKATKAGYEEELNPLYAHVEIDISEKNSNKPAGPAGFIHPGVLLNIDQLKEIKRRVQSGIEPQASAFKDLINSPLGDLNYKPTPWGTVSCGPRSTPNLGCKDEQRDGAAAYAQALLWFITENEKYATNAMNIMNSWSEKLKGGHDYANAPVQAAWVGSLWPRTAEIIRYTYKGWSDPEIAKFQNMLRTQYLPVIIHGDCENGNKELAMSEALINIGVFLDDREVFNLGLEIWRGRTPAYIYLKEDGEEPIQPPGCPPAYWSNKGLMPDLVDGILQETARDSHHHGMAFASMANAAETARQQGINLYGEEAKRIMASLEYVAQYLPPNNVPIPENLSFELLHTWEIAFNHYHNRLGFELPNTTKIIPTNRPTGVDHHMAWETLTHGDMGKIGLPELSGEKTIKD